MEIKVGKQYIQKYFKLYPVTVTKISKNKVWIKDPKLEKTFSLKKEYFERYFEEFTLGSLFGETFI